MKRQVFTSLAAAGLLACSIATASAAEFPFCKEKYHPICCWQQHCDSLRPPVQEDTPILPDIPDIPDVPIEPEQPYVPEEMPDQKPSSSMTELELAAARLVNEQRVQHGLNPLTIDADLSKKARIKSQDMKNNQYFSHNSPTYGTPFQMMQSLGISYRSAGENIAMGYSTAEAVVRAWMNSDSHRANILSNNYTSLGIGFDDGYWTQWFIG